MAPGENSGSPLTAYWGVESASKSRSRRANVHDEYDFVAVADSGAIRPHASRSPRFETPAEMRARSGEKNSLDRELCGYPWVRVWRRGFEITELPKADTTRLDFGSHARAPKERSSHRGGNHE